MDKTEFTNARVQKLILVFHLLRVLLPKRTARAGRQSGVLILEIKRTGSFHWWSTQPRRRGLLATMVMIGVLVLMNSISFLTAIAALYVTLVFLLLLLFLSSYKSLSVTSFKVTMQCIQFIES